MIVRSLLLFLAPLSVSAQSLTLGVTAGVPLTETIRGYQKSDRFGGYQAQSATRRWLAGGTVGAQFTSHLSISTGIQYRRFGYDYDIWYGFPVPLQFTHVRGTGASVEVPILLRWTILPRHAVRPYVSLGTTYRRLAGTKETSIGYDNFSLTNPQPVFQFSTSRPAFLTNRSAMAPSAAAGIEFRTGHLRIAPEIRYTRWISDTLGGFYQPIRWNWQQLDFLAGVAFPLGRR